MDRASRCDVENLACIRNAIVYCFRQCILSPTTSSDRYDGFVAYVTSNTFSLLSSTVVGPIEFFAQRSLDDPTIVLEFQGLHSGTAIVIYIAWLHTGNSLESMAFVLDISRGTLFTSTTTVAGGEGCVILSAFSNEDGGEWNSAGIMFVCSAYSAKPSSAFLYCIKCVVGNGRCNVVQIEVCDKPRLSFVRVEPVHRPIAHIILDFDSFLFMQ